MVSRDERLGGVGRNICVAVEGDTKGPLGMIVMLPTL